MFIMFVWNEARRDRRVWIVRREPGHSPRRAGLLGLALHAACRYGGAIAAFRRVPEPRHGHYANLATCAARLGEHDQASAYAAEAVRLKPHFTIAAYVMTLPYKDEADRVRETGPALEGMYQFMTWLVPAGEKLPRSQKFWPYGAGRCAWGRPGTVVMRRPLWSFGEARRAPVLPHPGSSFDRRTSPLSSGFTRDTRRFVHFSCGSNPEVSDGRENVGLWGRSGSRFRATGCLFIAKRCYEAEGRGLMLLRWFQH